MINRIGAKLCAALGLASLALAASWSAGASEAMRFTAHPPSPSLAHHLGNAWTIFADGTIDQDAVSRLRQLMREKRIPAYSSLVLNSLGGSIVGALELGRAIRASDLRTYVGRAHGASDRIEAGKCYSACSLAFLGGEYRYLWGASEYGVHRFYRLNRTAQDGDVAQILSAAIVQYIREMDVDPALFTEMTKSGATEINILPRERLVELSVVNDGQKKTKWTVESHNETGVYLKGERETVYGINKFMLMCSPARSIILYAIFDPQGREDEVLEMSAISLLLDGKSIPIADKRLAPVSVVNGWVNAAFSLGEDLLAQIQQARTVGISYQYTYEAPVFLGFSGMDFDEGSKKLPGIRRLCRAP